MEKQDWVKEIFIKTEKIKKEKGTDSYNFLRLFQVVQMAERLERHANQCEECQKYKAKLDDYFIRMDKEVFNQQDLPSYFGIIRRFVKLHLNEIAAHLFQKHGYRYLNTYKIRFLQNGLWTLLILNTLKYFKFISWSWPLNIGLMVIFFCVGYVIDKKNKNDGKIINDRNYKPKYLLEEEA